MFSIRYGSKLTTCCLNKCVFFNIKQVCKSSISQIQFLPYPVLFIMHFLADPSKVQDNSRTNSKNTLNTFEEMDDLPETSL